MWNNLKPHSPSLTPRSAAFRGWAIIGIAFLCYNLGNGIAYGSFGALLLVTQQHFAVSRGLASVGMSAIVLSFALSSPIVGALLQRRSPRKIILYGAGISAIGYAGLAISPEFSIAILSYVVIGFGLCLFAENAPLTLISRWFTSDRAKVIGIAQLPIATLVAPVVISTLLAAGYDRQSLLFGLAASYIAVAVAAAFFLVDRPESIGQEPWDRNGKSVQEPETAHTGPLLTSRDLLRSPRFWFICLGVGGISGSGICFVVHFIAFGTGQGMSIEWASTLVAFYAASGIVGNLLFGVIADRLGGVASLAITAFCGALLWGALAVAPDFLLPLIAILLGICTCPITPLYGTTMAMVFGRNVSRAYGLGYLVKLPFQFAMPPLIGFLFDLSGTYRLGFLMVAVIVALSGISCCLAIQLQRRRAAVPSE